MPCYYPIQGYMCPMEKKFKPCKDRQEAFQKGVSVSKFTKFSMAVPCGRCRGCRLERSRQWAIRCMHESKLRMFNSFVTLTYDDANLPCDFSLNKKHFQDFMKRIRKILSVPKLIVQNNLLIEDDGKVRYFHCGEYGETTKRPHYHALLFGLDFGDKKKFKVTDAGTLYTSKILDSIWQKGFCTIGAVNFDTAAYTARYAMKKVNGKLAKDHYKYVDLKTGTVYDRLPEYLTMSLKPGIGKEWFDRYNSDWYPSDKVTVRGNRCKPPRYYDNQFEIVNPQVFASVKQARKEYAELKVHDNTHERLLIKDEIVGSRIRTLRRSLD